MYYVLVSQSSVWIDLELGGVQIMKSHCVIYSTGFVICLFCLTIPILCPFLCKNKFYISIKQQVK